eukprot:2057726-Prymnesium_polylepis.1
MTKCGATTEPTTALEATITCAAGAPHGTTIEMGDTPCSSIATATAGLRAASVIITRPICDTAAAAAAAPTAPTIPASTAAVSGSTESVCLRTHQGLQACALACNRPPRRADSAHLACGAAGCVPQGHRSSTAAKRCRHRHNARGHTARKQSSACRFCGHPISSRCAHGAHPMARRRDIHAGVPFSASRGHIRRVPSGMISPTRSAVKPRVCSSCERKAATVSSAPKLSMTASSLSPGKVGSITCRSVLQFDGSAKSPNRGCVCRAAVVLATPSDADSPGLSPPSTSRRHVGLTLASPPMAAFTGPLHVALCTPSEAQ